MYINRSMNHRGDKTKKGTGLHHKCGLALGTLLVQMKQEARG